MFQFSDFMRICRERLYQTQQELVDSLAKFNKSFHALDATTLSRWERGVSKPSYSKQTIIAQYFSDALHKIYPFIDEFELEEIENSFCHGGLAKILGRHKLIMSFPTHHMDKTRFLVKTIAHSKLAKSAINKNHLMLQEMYHANISPENHHELTYHPSSFFAICEYDHEYYGHICLLKLTPCAFHRLIQFELCLDQLQVSDLAEIGEPGGFVFYGFFGMSDWVISRLWIHMYAWLIKHQLNIEMVGAIACSKEGELIAKNLNMEMECIHPTGQVEMHSYQTPLNQLLLNEGIIKMLFNPESCQD